MINISPPKAAIYYILLPITVMIINVILGFIFQLDLFFKTNGFLILIIFYFSLIWRLIVGNWTFKLISEKTHRLLKFRLFISSVIYNILLLPLVLFLIYGFMIDYPYLILGFVFFSVICGFIFNYFQCVFVANNFSIILDAKPKNSNLDFLYWTHISGFPFTAIKIQRTINYINKNASA